MPDLKTLIQDGIMLEEEFVEMYMNLLKEEEFIIYFEDKQEDAKNLLKVLLNDSLRHKKDLQDILSQI